MSARQEGTFWRENTNLQNFCLREIFIKRDTPGISNHRPLLWKPWPIIVNTRITTGQVKKTMYVSVSCHSSSLHHFVYFNFFYVRPFWTLHIRLWCLLINSLLRFRLLLSPWIVQLTIVETPVLWCGKIDIQRRLNSSKDKIEKKHVYGWKWSNSRWML